MSTLTAEQVEAFPYGDLDKYVDIGLDHLYATVACPNACPGRDRRCHGLIVPHLNRFGGWCGGAVTFRGHTGTVHWDLLDTDPMHVEPSLHCLGQVFEADEDGLAIGEIETCGDHGYIRAGCWVPA